MSKQNITLKIIFVSYLVTQVARKHHHGNLMNPWWNHSNHPSNNVRFESHLLLNQIEIVYIYIYIIYQLNDKRSQMAKHGIMPKYSPCNKDNLIHNTQIKHPIAFHSQLAKRQVMGCLFTVHNLIWVLPLSWCYLTFGILCFIPQCISTIQPFDSKVQVWQAWSECDYIIAGNMMYDKLIQCYWQ